MKSSNVRLCIFAIFLIFGKNAFGQGIQGADIGFVPSGMFQHTEIDSMNMENANAVIHIPLFGLPQRGNSLALEYGIFANTSIWQEDQFCFPDYDDEGGLCNNDYTMAGNTLIAGYGANPDVGSPECGAGPGSSPSVSRDDATPSWCVSPTTTWECHSTTGETGDPSSPPVCDTYVTDLFYVVEPTGERRRLQYDDSNLSLLRTTDGSGYLLHVNDPQPYFPFGTETCAGGVCEAPTKTFTGTLTNSKGVVISSSSETDLNGNLLEFGTDVITDTEQRAIASPPQNPTTTSTTGCPSLAVANIQYQPLTGSATWSVPGPNGAQTQYLFCFATVSYQTNFWGYGPAIHVTQDTHGDGSVTTSSFVESAGSEVVLQSLVLPNNTYWGFAYDGVYPNHPEAYGTIASILTPEKGSISYAYGTAYGCGADSEGEPFLLQYISQRTVADTNGDSYTWKYAFPPTLNTTSIPLNSVMTDPDKNDTVYGFASETATGSGCAYLPATTIHYAGSYSQNNALLTQDTSHQSVINLDPPYSPTYPTFANAAPLTVTDTDDAGNKRKTTYTYDSGFMSALPVCYTGSTSYNGGIATSASPVCQQTFVATQPASLGMQASRTDFSFDGSALDSQITNYKWQEGTLAGNPYYTKNALTLPCLEAVFSTGAPTGTTPTCILDATQSNLSAETSYGYDESGSPQGVRGNRTSVNRLVIVGNSTLTTGTVYNGLGMPISTTDSLGHTTTLDYSTSTNCPDDSTGLFPSKIQQPSTNGTPHIDYYCHDANTANLIWHTDQNGSGSFDLAHTTQYTYNDPFGRLRKVLGPPVSISSGQTSHSETDVAYDDNALTVTTTLKADPNPAQTSAKTYDSLGRLIQTRAASGVMQHTTYDSLNHVVSVSNPYLAISDLTYGFTSYAYDALGRVQYRCQSDSGNGSGPCIPGSSYLQWLYSGNVATSFDESRNSTQRTVDALGRLTRVVERGPLTTNYAYDSVGNLLSVHQNGNGTSDTPRIRSFTYDSLSRLLISTNPETGTVCYGQWSSGSCTNGYDGNGNLQAKTDARNITISYNYDGLNRLLSKTYSDSITPSSCYSYDAATTNGVGHLALEWTQSGGCGTSPPSNPISLRLFVAYDPMGQLLQDKRCTGSDRCSSQAYRPMAYSYDLAGNNIGSSDGVSNRLFITQYDSAGRLLTFVGGIPNSSPPSAVPLFSVQYYGALGWTGASFGLNLNAQRTYDSRTRLTGESVVIP